MTAGFTLGSLFGGQNSEVCGLWYVNTALGCESTLKEA